LDFFIISIDLRVCQISAHRTSWIMTSSVFRQFEPQTQYSPFSKMNQITQHQQGQ